jgi:hypothetical protein
MSDSSGGNAGWVPPINVNTMSGGQGFTMNAGS